MLLEKNSFPKWWVAQSTQPRGAGGAVKSQSSIKKTSRRFNIQLNLKPLYLENKGERRLVLQTFCHKIKHDWPRSKGLLELIKTTSPVLEDCTLPSQEIFRVTAGKDSAVHRSSKGPKEMKEFRTGHWDLKNNLKVRFCLWDIFCFLLDSTGVSN